MSETLILETGDGRTVSCLFSQIQDISQSFVFFDMDSPDDVDYWRAWFEDYAKNIALYLLEHVTIAKLTVSCNGIYEQHETGTLSESLTMNSAYPATLTRHHRDLSGKIRNQFLAIHNPNEYYMRLQDQFGSKIGHMHMYNSLTLSFQFPYEYNARSLPTNFRLHNCTLTNFLKFLPYNTDDYCLLHTIFGSGMDLPARKSLNKNEEYMESFKEWFDENSLWEFYIDGFFNLDNIETLEQRLDVNLNIYTFEKKKPELFYRSAYKQDIEKIYNIIVIPVEYFYDNHKKNPVFDKKKVKRVITSTHQLGEDFLANISVKNFIKRRDAHCALLDTNIFQKRKKGSNKISYKKICRYCTGNFNNNVIEAHETACKDSFDGNKKERIKVYKELAPGKDKKDFNKYIAKYRVPFAVYDFETRLIDGRHIPFSYSILYLNVFDFSKSIKFLRSNQDSEALLENFLEDIETVNLHHYGLQSIDTADPDEKAAAKLPEDGKCPLCLEHCFEFEYNHSHFEGDTLNKHLDMYICGNCNKTCMIKNKPLKFYGHNASRFDNNLFMERLLNSENFFNFDFLAKTESRFTQVTGALSGNSKVKTSFNDSRLIVQGALGDLANAWITKADESRLKALLGLFYKQNLDGILDISTKKQVFPYAALSQETLLDEKVIDKEHFYDDLYNEAISDEDYKVYQEASSRLESLVGSGYRFLDYHDFYLALDVVLLAMVLFNFSAVCIETNGINPLWYVSVSSYSFGSLLHHNKYSGNMPDIKIPAIAVQKFLQRSIRGGFSQIFNKQLPGFNEKTDICSYYDFNSLYPSVMATVKLPYEFVRWIDGDGGVENHLEYMEKHSDDKYYFVEVDIAPLGEEYQDKVSKLPLFPENREVKPEYLSEDQLYRWSKNNTKKGPGKNFKGETINCVTFFEKKNYICSYSYLKQALEVGYKIDKIHRIAEFEADYIMADYVKKIYQLKKKASIEKNNLIKEIAATTDTEKLASLKMALKAVEARITAFKIIANGLYGSTIVNQERHSETEMLDVTETKSLKKRVSSLRFKSLYHAGGKVLVNSMKSSYSLSYPLSLGSAILWESKLLMTRFVYSLYDYLKEHGLEFNPMMTDTDSYIFHIPRFTEKFKSIDQFTYLFNKNCYPVFDTSFNEAEYQQPETHEELCFMKNETKNEPITNFNGICSKVYSFNDKIKGKGVSKKLQKKYLSSELYESIIDGTGLDDDHNCEFGNFSVGKLKVDTVRVSKSYITLVDIKSWYGKNGITPLVFGSKAHLDEISRNQKTGGKK